MNDGGSRPQNDNVGGDPGNGGQGGNGNGGGGHQGGRPAGERGDRGDRGDRGPRGGSRLRGTGREPGRISRVPADGRGGHGGQSGQGGGSSRGDGPSGGGGGGRGRDGNRDRDRGRDGSRDRRPGGGRPPMASGASSGGGGPAPRASQPSAPDPMPADPVITPEARALALTAWDLARTRRDKEDTPRGKLMTLRTHQKLISAIETGRRIPEEDRTFLRVRENARGSFLLIHGMSTGPADLRGLAKHLGDNECNVWVMRLPELGATPGQVSHASWESSLLQARQRCRMLSRGGGDLHVVGLGYGAALALHLASEEPVSSVVLLAPALMPRASAFQRSIVRLRLHRLGFFRKLLGLNADLLEGMDVARSRVNRVKVPMYAAQCDDDDRASPASLRFLQRKAHNRESRFQLFPTGGHAILATHGERVLYGEILKFCGVR